VIRGILLAMEIGDRDYVMDFLILESGYRGGEKGKNHAEFIRAAEAIMQGHPDPLFQTTLRLLQGVRAYLSIDREFKEAFEMLERTDEEFAQTANAAWELSAGRFFLTYSLHKMGDFARLRTYAERFVKEAEQRGNVYTRTTINRLSNILWLVNDDPDGAREDLKTDSWISYNQGYHSQHWLELNAQVEIAMYEGSPIDKDFLAQHLKLLKKSFMQRVLGYRCDTAWLVGRLALSEAVRDPSRQRAARRSIAHLASYKTHYASVLSRMLRATLALQQRDRDTAATCFREVVTMADQTNHYFLSAAARRRLGALVGGDEGRDLVTAAERWMAEAGIKDFDRMTNLASPCGEAM